MNQDLAVVSLRFQLVKTNVVMNEAGETLGGVDLEGNSIPGLTIPIVNDTRKRSK